MIFYIKERQMKNNFSKNYIFYIFFKTETYFDIFFIWNKSFKTKFMKKKCHKSNFIYKISKKFKLENVDFQLKKSKKNHLKNQNQIIKNSTFDE